MIPKVNFRLTSNLDIEALIRFRKNLSFNAHDCMPRRFAVVEQLGNGDWKRKRKSYVWVDG
jgi:hypothetical protein